MRIADRGLGRVAGESNRAVWIERNANALDMLAEGLETDAGEWLRIVTIGEREFVEFSSECLGLKRVQLSSKRKIDIGTRMRALGARAK